MWVGEVLLAPRRLDRRGDHLTRRHLEVPDQALRPVPLVLELHLLDLTRPHRLGRGDPLLRLDARHLVHAHRVNPVLRPSRGRLVAVAHVPDLPGERLGILGRALSQCDRSSAAFKKRPTWRAEIDGTMPRSTTSSANSVGVQWVTGRPLRRLHRRRR